MCVGACGLVAHCDEYQLGGNEKAVLTCVLSILYSLFQNYEYYNR